MPKFQCKYRELFSLYVFKKKKNIGIQKFLCLTYSKILLQLGKCHGDKRKNVTVAQKIQILFLHQSITKAVDAYNISILL